MVPTGNTTEAAHAFYNYLWAYYLKSIPMPRTTVMWSGVIYTALFVVALSAFFWFYVRYGLHVHRKKGELYGIQSFAGSILERIGPLSAFDWFIIVVVVAWTLYYIITLTYGGYLYVNPVH